ncbi:MAG: nitronate monooxygenase family protein [Halobacteriota archaeon]|nr:nitronate monooxygenase family protein [Halobacteriota archaeon]
MAIKTRLTERLGIMSPIFLAGMGPFSTYKTAEKVANAGGVGVTSHWNIVSKVNPRTFQIDEENENAKVVTSLEKTEYDLNYLSKNTRDGAAIGCNVLVSRIQLDSIQMIDLILRMREEDPVLKEKLKVIVTSAGSPKPPARQIRDWKKSTDSNDDLMHFHVVPTVRHAKKAIDVGCEGLIAAGYEGGGHQSYEGVNTSVLVPQIRAAYPDTYIVASGGFYDGITLSSALSLGADAIQMGTRFISAKDSDFHPNFKDIILKSESEDTLICSGAFGPIRLIKNSYAFDHSEIVSREVCIEKERMRSAALGGGEPSFEFLSDMKKYDAVYAGDVENGAVLAGQTCGGIKRLETVEDIMNKSIKDAEENIRRVYGLLK